MLEATVKASADCSCVSNLQSVELVNGELSRLHSTCLGACRNLCHLRCKSAYIDALVTPDILAMTCYATLIPNGISLLTQLSSLDMRVERSNSLGSVGEFDLSWLTHLTNLQKLKIDCDHRVTSMSGLTGLSSLEDLSFIMHSTLPTRMDVDWAAFKQLKQLRLQGRLILVDAYDSCDRLQGLATIETLSDVYLEIGSESRMECRVALKRAVEECGSRVTLR